MDESMIMFNSREYKQFSKNLLQFFLLHRHYRVDCCLFSQGWDSVDRTIRLICDRCFYIYKTPILGHWVTRWYRIPYGIIIPDPKKGNEKLGEIVQGYCKPGLLARLFGGYCYRPLYYKYFDSFEAPQLEPIPKERTKHIIKPYNVDKLKKYLELPQEARVYKRDAV